MSEPPPTSPVGVLLGVRDTSAPHAQELSCPCRPEPAALVWTRVVPFLERQLLRSE
ncbi:MAG TPA: hypothetical protein VFW38_01055 [Solirubrobacteraceae bacterium]|nr:hypothetical protein [Solirubrobacteraceae bacterium]